MTGPRTKRPFAGAAADPAQRQITAFFNAPSPGTPPGSPISRQQLPPHHHDARIGLTDGEQASLLTVGMRVRKAVPEGYKTGAGHGGPPSFRHASTNILTTVAAGGGGGGSGGGGCGGSLGGQKELLPFCGIHKIGGLEVQHHQHHHQQPELGPGPGPMALVDRRRDAFESPGSSQDSMASVGSAASGITGARTRKRFLPADDDADPEHLHDVPEHRLNLNLAAPAPDGVLGLRAIMTMPRRGRKLALPAHDRFLVGEENDDGGAGAGDANGDDDFGEAGFLDHHAWTEAEMGDI